MKLQTINEYHSLINENKSFKPGTIREWDGKKYKKQFNGKWLEVSKKHEMTKKEHKEKSDKLWDEAESHEHEAEQHSQGTETKGGNYEAAIKHGNLSSKFKRDSIKHEYYGNKLSDKEHSDSEVGIGNSHSDRPNDTAYSNSELNHKNEATNKSIIQVYNMISEIDDIDSIQEIGIVISRSEWSKRSEFAAKNKIYGQIHKILPDKSVISDLDKLHSKINESLHPSDPGYRSAKMKEYSTAKSLVGKTVQVDYEGKHHSAKLIDVKWYDYKSIMVSYTFEIGNEEVTTNKNIIVH